MINYTWLVKNITADMRGYATIGYFELQGTNDLGTVATSSITVCFGADELRPIAQWTQAVIDNYAESKRADMEVDLTARITALEAK